VKVFERRAHCAVLHIPAFARHSQLMQQVIKPILVLMIDKSTITREQTSSSPMTRSVRRNELRKLVPLADTTIYEMERRGEFPKRFNLSPRCVAWDLQEVEAWIAKRRLVSNSSDETRPPSPDVRLRKHRPVKRPLQSNL
jgi:prophage regulatory protein